MNVCEPNPNTTSSTINNQRTVGKKTENSYPIGCIKQSGGNRLRKWLSDQGKFSAIRVGQKLQNS